MGFRSTFTTEDYALTWPLWFREKYANSIRFGKDGGGTLSSAFEGKAYGIFENLHTDIQKSIDWQKFTAPSFVLVFLHERGGITRCQIEKDLVTWTEPIDWRVTRGVEHSYCTGCSDAHTI